MRKQEEEEEREKPQAEAPLMLLERMGKKKMGWPFVKRVGVGPTITQTCRD